MTTQLLNKSHLINKPKYINSSMALFKITSKKQNFNLSSNYIKTFYNKAIAKYIYYKKLFYKVVNYSILYFKFIQPS